jgi:stage II sporulation protein M
MNKIFKNSNNSINNQKSKYIFLIIILIIGIISGIIFIFFLNNKDKLLVEKELDIIISSINNNELDVFNTLKNSLSSNIISLISIYFLGISIIGLPVILLFVFFKGFIFGFSISSIISTYKLKGILLSFSYLFPTHIILLIIWILFSFYSINFSIKLFRYLFFKENINLKYYFKNLNKIFIICFLGCLICSLLESFLSVFLIDLFS